MHKEVKQEWSGRINKPLGPGLHFAIDGLDWKSQAPKKEQPGFKEQRGYKFILCAIDRATRKFYAKALRTRSAEETRDALLEILREAGAMDTLQEISFDSASEFLSKEMTAALRTIGPNEHGVTIHVKPPGRESMNDIADLDASDSE